MLAIFKSTTKREETTGGVLVATVLLLAAAVGTPMYHVLYHPTDRCLI
jgi:hypothetical protein